MQSSHVFTNVTGDIAGDIGAEMSEAQVKRLKSISFCGTHTFVRSQRDSLIHFFVCVLKRAHSCVYLDCS